MCYVPIKKDFTIYYASEYALQKGVNFLKKQYTSTDVIIGNSKHDRQKEADRTMVVHDIPLNIKSEIVKQYFTQYGIIVRFLITTTGFWQRAYVIYDITSIVDQLRTRVWSLTIINFSVHMHSLNLSVDEMEERNAYILKLSDLPRDTTQLDLDFIIQDINAKSCYIPRLAKSYAPLLFALLQFDSNNRVHAAYDKSFTIKGRKLYWSVSGLSHYFTCGNLDHQSNKYPQ